MPTPSGDVATVGQYISLIQTQLQALEHLVDSLFPSSNVALVLAGRNITGAGDVNSNTLTLNTELTEPRPVGGATFYYDGTNLNSINASGVVVTYVNSLSPTIANFAEFFALMPGDNASTIAINGPIGFPQAGPASTSTSITALSQYSFQLGPAGIYEVSWQVSVTEAGQVVVCADNSLLVGALVAAPHKILRTVVGRATGTSQLIGRTLVQSSAPSATLSIRNGASASALTITPIAGGTDSTSANLVIRQVA